MPHDLLITNARLSGAAPGTLTDIAVTSGRIAAIAPNLAASTTAHETLDAAGRFVSPGLVEAHFHLDKALIVERCAPPADRRATDHMARTAAIKHTFTVEDIYARARATLEQCLLNGVTHMRTQVEVDPNVGLRGYEAIERLARGYAWAIDLQPCVFLQEGWTNVPGAEATVVAALKRGARVVGGAPRYDTDRPAQIERIFALAREYDADIDIHLDGGYTTHDLDIWQVCDLTDRIGWGGRVAIGHGSKYSCLPEADLAALGRRLADAGVAVAVLPATDLFNNGRHLEHSVIRGVADGNALIAAGATCAVSTNNVMNPFTPFGDCSLVRILNMYANVVQRGTEEDLAVVFDMATGQAARILRLDDYGLAVGNPADLVLWNATSPAEVVARIAPPLAAFKRGRRLFTWELPELLRD
jgi:cytosine deaminase